MMSNVRTMHVQSPDTGTAAAFASSWNNLPDGSVYTADQIEEWFSPITNNEIADKTVLELGCGNGSLLSYLTRWRPQYLEGVDLGDSVLSCARNMNQTGFQSFRVTRADMIQFQSDGFDVVYSIGVLHHLKNPKWGFEAVLRNTRAGGRFHCWVYAREGNSLVINLVEPIRKIASRLPWWITKYALAAPLAVPFFLYAKSIAKSDSFSWLPLFEYSKWISKRGFDFFRHVAFDQLVTPQTTYLSKETIDTWLRDSGEIDDGSTYLICRNGNSWKFGGKKKGLTRSRRLQSTEVGL